MQEGPSCPTVWVIWAETASLDPSPSLLLGYALLTSRRASAMFLRMTTGFGFAQVSDCPLVHPDWASLSSFIPPSAFHSLKRRSCLA